MSGSLTPISVEQFRTVLLDTMAAYSNLSSRNSRTLEYKQANALSTHLLSFEATQRAMLEAFVTGPGGTSPHSMKTLVAAQLMQSLPLDSTLRRSLSSAIRAEDTPPMVFPDAPSGMRFVNRQPSRDSQIRSALSAAITTLDTSLWVSAILSAQADFRELFPDQFHRVESYLTALNTLYVINAGSYAAAIRTLLLDHIRSCDPGSLSGILLNKLAAKQTPTVSVPTAETSSLFGSHALQARIKDQKRARMKMLNLLGAAVEPHTFPALPPAPVTIIRNPHGSSGQAIMVAIPMATAITAAGGGRSTPPSPAHRDLDSGRGSGTGSVHPS